MGVNRRTFLQSAAVLAVGGASADTPNWEKLRRKLSGQLVLPSDQGYDDLRRPYNHVYAHRRPAAIARCTRPEDVQACLDFASHERVPVAARSGGHSYAGYSVPENGLVVDLKAMSTTTQSGNTITTGAGTRMLDLYQSIKGRALPAGSCATVGIGGLTLGGGISIVGRKFGLTCDNLLKARIVTPDGCLRTVSHDDDLLWALKGGGGGNFGIVTEFTFRTAPAPDLTTFVLRYPAGTATDVLGRWQDWVDGARDELWAACTLISQGPVVFGTYVGPKSELNPLLDRFTHGLPQVPREILEMDFLTTVRWFAGCRPTCEPDLGSPFVSTSRMVHQKLDPAKTAELVAPHESLSVQFDSFGGAIGRVAENATAFPHRNALSSVQINQPAKDEAEARRIVARVRDGLGAGTTGYVNYIDPEMPDWATAYYGRNLPRLKRIANRYDPDRVLRFGQSL